MCLSRSLRATVLSLSLLAPIFSQAQQPTGPDATPHNDAFDRDARDLAELLQLPGLLVAVAQDGRLIHTFTHGHADLESQTPLTADHLFWVASVTKTFTATLTMQLVEQGRLSLDDPVTRYWFGGFFPTRITPDITIRQVLGHTSQGTPGRTFVYHGGRFNFVYGAFDAAAGKPFNECLIERIIEPLGLRSTMPGIGDGRYRALRDRLVKPYRFDPKAGRYVPEPQVMRFGDVYPATGLAMTAGDLALYADALDGHRLVSAESHDAMTRPAISTDGRPLPYGVGWFTQEVGGLRVAWHYGYGLADSALFIRVPDKRLTLIALSNSDQMSAATSLGDGNVLASPIAASFFRHFVFPQSPALPSPHLAADRAEMIAIAGTIPSDAQHPPLHLDQLFAAAVTQSYVARTFNHDDARVVDLLLALRELDPTYLDRTDLSHLNLLSRVRDDRFAAQTAGLIDRLLAQQPENPAVHTAAARFHESRGETDAALGHLRTLADSPGYDEDDNKLTALVRLGEHLAADQPGPAAAYLWRAKVAMFNTGNDDAAMRQRIDAALRIALSAAGP